MTKDEALTMALDALLKLPASNWYPETAERNYTAITAIKAALAQEQDHFADTGKPMQPEQEPQLTPSGIHKIGCVNHDCQHCKANQDWEAIAADQAMTIAMMLSEQEPVEYQYRTRPDWIPEWNRWNTCSKDSADAYKKNPYLHDWHYEVRTLYAAPPKRQPLTNDEIYEMYNEPRSDAEMVAFARAIEAAHGTGDKT